MLKNQRQSSDDWVKNSLYLYLEIKIFKKLFSIQYYMTKLLDLDDDILYIIGNYVKKDNERKIKKEKDFESTDYIMNRLKMKNNFTREEIGEAIYSQLFKKCYTSEEIQEYIDTRELNKYLSK